MENTVIEGQEKNGTEAVTQERTFTQAEVNAIVEGRLKKESAKYSDYEAMKEKASKFDEMEEAKNQNFRRRMKRLKHCRSRLMQ